MSDWTEADISGISEADFPVRCDRCDYLLNGLGEQGRCPECAHQFRRRERLWLMHGPEAFAEPSIVDEPSAASDAASMFVFAVFSVLLFIGLFLVIVLAGKSLFGTIDLCFTITAWVVVASCLEWIALRRFVERREAELPEADHAVEDDGGD